eukprot:SAG11_NODE_15622_length_571_cov_1.563559_1_plen_27_part_10
MVSARAVRYRTKFSTTVSHSVPWYPDF